MFTTAAREGKSFATEQKNKTAQEQNYKTECPKDEGTAHNHNFAVCREYEQC